MDASADPPAGPVRLEVVDRSGPAVSFEAFVEAEYRSLLRLAWSLTGSGEAAEDAVQDALLAVHRRWADVGGYDRPGAYARRVLLNGLTSRARRRRSERRALERLGRPGVHHDPAPPDAAFWAAVGALPARQRQVVVLRYVEDLGVADVAAILGVAEGTVKAHLHRARAALADALADEGGPT